LVGDAPSSNAKQPQSILGRLWDRLELLPSHRKTSRHDVVNILRCDASRNVTPYDLEVGVEESFELESRPCVVRGHHRPSLIVIIHTLIYGRIDANSVMGIADDLRFNRPATVINSARWTVDVGEFVIVMSCEVTEIVSCYISMMIDKQQDSETQEKATSSSPITFRLDAKSGVPTYLQLVQQVEHALRLGFLELGDQLPTVKEVVSSLSINPNTVIKAYADLEGKKIAVGRPGQGTFIVSVPETIDMTQLNNLRRSLKRGWLRSAFDAGLDSDGVEALFASTLREFILEIAESPDSLTVDTELLA